MTAELPESLPRALWAAPTAVFTVALVRRVVIGNFGAIAGMGIRDVVTQCACQVVGEEPDGDSLATCIERLRPDAVVLDAEHGAGEALAAELSGRFPDIVVVTVSSSRPEFRVYPPHGDGTSYGQMLDGDALARALG